MINIVPATFPFFPSNRQGCGSGSGCFCRIRIQVFLSDPNPYFNRNRIKFEHLDSKSISFKYVLTKVKIQYYYFNIMTFLSLSKIYIWVRSGLFFENRVRICFSLTVGSWFFRGMDPGQLQLDQQPFYNGTISALTLSNFI